MLEHAAGVWPLTPRLLITSHQLITPGRAGRCRLVARACSITGNLGDVCDLDETARRFDHEPIFEIGCGTSKDTGISVFAPENWPLPWYLRNYNKTGYWGEFKSEVNTDMYIASMAQDAQMTGKLGDKFEKLGLYNMRGVVDLLLYVRKVGP